MSEQQEEEDQQNKDQQELRTYREQEAAKLTHWRKIDSPSPAIVNEYMVRETVYVKTQDQVFDCYDQSRLSIAAFNNTMRRWFKVKTTPLNYVMGRPDRHVVKDYCWYPEPYREKGYLAENYIINIEGIDYLNTFRYLTTPQQGSVDHWLKLLEHLVPHDDYRSALLWYLAHIVQRPHVKTTWNPIILGIEGAGKDSLLRPIWQIIPTKSCSTRSFESAYEDYLYETKLLIINESAGLNKRTVEHYKKLTGSEASKVVEINPKGKGTINQVDMFAVVMLSNHLGAMQISQNDRRCFVLNAQDKLPTEQAQEYYKWLETTPAHSYIMHYLLTYPLDDFPYTAHQLPYRTEWVDEMIEASTGDFESEVLRVLSGMDAISPDMLVPYLHSQGYSNGNIKKDLLAVLHRNNWVKWTTQANGTQIQKKVGTEVKKHSRSWLVRKDKFKQYEKPSDMFDLCETVTAMLEKMLKKDSKY
jgi:hypothetical protein